VPKTQFAKTQVPQSTGWPDKVANTKLSENRIKACQWD